MTNIFDFVFGGFDLTTHPIRDFWIAVMVLIVTVCVIMYSAGAYIRDCAENVVPDNMVEHYFTPFFWITITGMLLAAVAGFTYNVQSAALVMVVTALIGIWRLSKAELLLTEEMQER